MNTNCSETETNKLENSFLAESSEDRLLDLLTGFNLQCAYSSLKICGFNINNVKYINDNDLDRVFPERESIAFKAELREKLSSWKAEKFPEDYAAKCCNCHSQKSGAASSKNSIRNPVVTDILNESPFGRGLVYCICEAYFDSKYQAPRPTEIAEIATQIAALFPTESSEIYYVSRKDGKKHNPSGLLFNRFNNLNRNRKQDFSAPSPFSLSQEEISENSIVPGEIELGFKKSKIYFMSNEDEEAMQLWTDTFKIRNIIIISKENCPYFIVSQLTIIEFNEHLQSYKVGLESDFVKIININKFTGPPIHLAYMSDGSQYFGNKTF